jgi:hypothetical protein
MGEVAIDIKIYCDRCGAGLNGNIDYDESIYVIPCEKCIQAAMDKGYTAGWEEGGGS